MLSKKAEFEIRKIAIKNALDYGSARKEKVIGKVIASFPELKAELNELSNVVAAIIAQVNSTPRDALGRAAEAYADEFEAEKAEKAERSGKHSYLLEGAVKGAFATRFPPQPNGFMHIGHAKSAFIEKEAAGIYAGKLALYFDDTNPEVERQLFVDSIKNDLDWLGLAFNEEYYASDSIERLYEHAGSLVGKGAAYVCMCNPEEVKAGRFDSKACVHSEQKSSENARLWKAMLSRELNSGILRLRGDMAAKNTTMRDPTLFRIKKEEHYRQGAKYSVWPTYDFNTPIIDSTKGITDVIRSKEFELRDELYYTILDLLGLRKPRIHSISRLEISNNITSKRKLNAFLKEGLIQGYDDPRLVTIAALRRRGITPLAIQKFVMRFGMSKTESSIGIDVLLAENRKVIEAYSKRLFFVKEPVRLSVEGIGEAVQRVSIRLHPAEELGYRDYTLGNVFFINAYDANKLEAGQKVRLKDAFDIRITGRDGSSLKAVYEEGDDAKGRIPWVNEGNYAECKIHMIGDLLSGERFNRDSMIVYEGYVEAYSKQLGEGDTVQFDRLGFFKLDSKSELSFLSL